MSTATKIRLHQAIGDALAFRNLFPASLYLQWCTAGSVRRQVPMIGDVEHVIIPRIREEPGSGLFAEPVKVNVLLARVDELLAMGTFEKHVYPDGRNRWGEKHRGIEFRGLNHEIFLADARNWGSALAIRTGPGELSKALVCGLQRHGYLNRLGYVRNKNSWTCACGWAGQAPEWLPMESGDYTRQTREGIREAPHCPRCKKPNGPEPVIIDCPDEASFFAMAGFQFIPPERRQ